MHTELLLLNPTTGEDSWVLTVSNPRGSLYPQEFDVDPSTKKVFIACQTYDSDLSRNFFTAFSYDQSINDSWTSDYWTNGYSSQAANSVSARNGKAVFAGNIGYSNYLDPAIMGLNFSGTAQWYGFRTGSNGTFFNFVALNDAATNLYMYTPTPTNSLLEKRNISSGFGTSTWCIVYGTNISGSGGRRLVVDSSENVYMAFASRIVKFSTSGSITWQRSASQEFSSVAVGPTTGNVYLVLPGTTNNQSWVVCYNSSGTLQWQRSVTSSGSSPAISLNKICTDGSDNVYVAGFGRSGSEFESSMAILKYNSSGSLQWQRGLSTTNGVNMGETYGITVVGDYYYLNNQGNSSLQSSCIVAKLPTDGSKTGTYNPSVKYWAQSYTDAAGALTFTTPTTTTTSTSTSFSSTTPPSETGYNLSTSRQIL